MCGISGILLKTTSNNQFLPRIIKLMTNKLKHRGPDDEGYSLFNLSNFNFITAGSGDTDEKSWNANFKHSPKDRIEDISGNYHLGFGHRRLSVIDLSEASHQPICDETGKIWLTLNGEIYNFRDIKNELINEGYNFFSKGDSEVLLKAYKHWGFECFSKFDGMWSFVIYDIDKNILLGSRDRFGVKPLYYYSDDNYFAFASEHKALLEIPEIKTSVNYNEVINYLYFNKIEVDNTGIFENIFELPPSHYFIFDLTNNEMSIKKYYTLNFNSQIENFSKSKYDFYTNKVNELITKSIESRLLSDINIGFCLSGGIDSSSIVCTANKISNTNEFLQLGSRLITFTATNSYENYNEENWARIVANHVHSNYYTAECNSKNLFEKLDEIIYFQDIPLLSTSTYAQYKVMEAASNNNINVLIDGQGGDELFAGYAPFFCSFYTELLLNKNFKHLANELKNIDFSPLTIDVYFKAIIKNFADNIFADDLKLSFLKLFKNESKYFFDKVIEKNVKNISLASDYKFKGTNWLLHYFFTGNFLKNLLRWEDRCSMAFSIESRTPFSDNLNLIEYMFTIPSIYKINNGWSKSILRSAMKGVVPSAILNRTDKMGFSTPEIHWLKNESYQMQKKIKELYDNELINIDLLLSNWNELINNPKGISFLWKYMNYLIWKSLYFQK